jgi:hypothetical protein
VTAEAGSVTQVLAVERSEAVRAQINLRYWPGWSASRVTEIPSPSTRLRDRLVLYVFALPERLAIPERLGLGGWLLALGGLILGVGIFYDDPLAERDPAALDALSAWALRHPLDSPAGPCVLRCISLTCFNRDVFAVHAYVGRMAVIGADLGRTLALLADYWGTASRRGFGGGWCLGLRGWGVRVPRRLGSGTTRWSTSYGRPLVYVKAVGVHGTLAQFGYPRSNPEGLRRGVWVRGPSGRDVPYPGVFVDVIGAAFALDGTDSGELDDHLAAWDLPQIATPFALPVAPEGAAAVIECLRSVHRMTLAVDNEAVQWG